MNVIARLECELAFYDSAVHRVNYYTTKTPPNNFCDWSTNDFRAVSNQILEMFFPHTYVLSTFGRFSKCSFHIRNVLLGWQLLVLLLKGTFFYSLHLLSAVCIYIYICTYTHVCIFFKHTHIYMYTHIIYIHTYTFIYRFEIIYIS